MANPSNNGTIIGRLGADPELRYTNEGTAVASFRIAVPDGFKKDVSHWFDGVAWRQQAEFLANYCKKGDRIAIAFHLKTEEWETKEGEKRTKVKLEADAVNNLSPKREGDEADEKPAKKKPSRDDEDEKPAKKKARREDDEDDEDEKPAKKKSRRDEDEDEDEKPAKKKARRDDDEEFESV